MPQAQEQRADVGVEHAVVDIGALLLEWRATLLEAGIVEGDVVTAKAFKGRADHPFDLVLSRDVGPDRNRLRTELAAGSRGSFDFGLAPACSNHRFGTLGCHPQRRGAADAAAAARDEADLAAHPLTGWRISAHGSLRNACARRCAHIVV